MNKHEKNCTTLEQSSVLFDVLGYVDTLFYWYEQPMIDDTVEWVIKVGIESFDDEREFYHWIPAYTLSELLAMMPCEFIYEGKLHRHALERDVIYIYQDAEPNTPVWMSYSRGGVVYSHVEILLWMIAKGITTPEKCRKRLEDWYNV